MPSPLRAVARPLLAATFVTGGAQALRDPGRRPELLASKGIEHAQTVVRANGAAMTVAGLALASGRWPRLSALVLAGTLAPTTYVGHAFWTHDDPQARAQQQIHFIKNLSLIGGLLLAVADTGGRESVPHAAARMSRRARRRAASAARAATAVVPG